MLTEDLSEFYGDFAVPATLQGVAVPSGVMFRAEYVDVLQDRLEGQSPAVLAIAAEVPAVAQDQVLVIAAVPELGVPGGTYVVRNVRPDGTGLVVLRLSET